MIRSMTGFGRATKTLNNMEITVELRSVNSRGLDCTVKMPRMYAFAESVVLKRVKESVARAKLDVYINIKILEQADLKISVDRSVIEGYLSALNGIAEQYGVRNDISVMALSRMPDVFVVEKAEEDEEQITNDILAVLSEALEKYNQMRTVEGQALEDDLRTRAKTILSTLEQVEERSIITLEEYRQRLTRKMLEVLENTNIDEARILQEAAIFADRVAIDEETVRLRSHLAQLETMLDNGGAFERKLDFLLQEMNRETNTIGSKCNDLEVTKNVVAIKAELEKIREQAQNIE